MYEVVTLYTGNSARVLALRDCLAAAGCRTFLPEEDGYRQVCNLWNGAVRAEPVAVARCQSVEDVSTALRAALKYGFAVSVRGGGHGWSGRALRDGGLVIDLSLMRNVSVDSSTRIATVAGGARAADVMKAGSSHGLVAATGNVGAVGMAGLTLGGGYGPLTPRLGLALDNLLAADVILADGRTVFADQANNPELYWALRGGGGNFGVVTSMRVQLHSIREVLGGVILFPWSDANAVLQGYGDIIRQAPDDLSVLAGVFSGPDGNPAILLSPTWCGETARGLRYMAALRALGTAVFADIRPMSGADLLATYDAHVVNGRHYAVETRWIAELTPNIISALIAAGAARSSPLSIIALHHFHGVGTRVSQASTAFGIRRRHFMVEIVTAWDAKTGEGAAAHHDWGRALSLALAPFSLPGGYANLLAPDAYEQIAYAYGANAERLRRIKRHFDPNDVFSSANPLPED
jgi:FAD/FMN-containing dehydrogenase